LVHPGTLAGRSESLNIAEKAMLLGSSVNEEHEQQLS
jgi:hypothetical protein